MFKLLPSNLRKINTKIFPKQAFKISPQGITRNASDRYIPNNIDEFGMRILDKDKFLTHVKELGSGESVFASVFKFFNEVAATIDDIFTKFDTPEIVKARKELSEVPLTHLIKTPKRDLLRNDIAKKLYGNRALAKEKQVYIVMGPPTSGKSTALCEPLAIKKKAMIIDPDIAKEEIPEYNGGKFAAAVHEESWMITKQLMDKAIDANDNVVLPLVGSYMDEILEICNKFEKADYNVHLRLFDVSPEEAAKRAVVRYNKSGRFVDPYYVYNEVSCLPKENYKKLLQAKNFDTYASFSNEVPKGQPPILLEKSANLPDVFD